MENIIKNKDAKTIGGAFGIDSAREDELVLILKGAALESVTGGEHPVHILHKLIEDKVLKNYQEYAFASYMLGGVGALLMKAFEQIGQLEEAIGAIKGKLDKDKEPSDKSKKPLHS